MTREAPIAIMEIMLAWVIILNILLRVRKFFPIMLQITANTIKITTSPIYKVKAGSFALTPSL